MTPSAFNFEPNLARAATIPASWYTDPARLELERKTVFSRTWQFAGSLDALQSPDSYTTVEVCGFPLVLTRDSQGTIRAFYNVCRHRAGVVANGSAQRKTLQCQYHGWVYGLDGCLKNTPEFEGVDNFDKNEYGLVPVRVETWGGLVFVNISGSAPPLIEYLGHIVEETRGLELGAGRLIERREYFVYANWKIYVDNYLEGYHLPIAHPELYREIDYDQYRVDTFLYHSSQHAPIRPTIGDNAANRVYGSAGNTNRPAFFYWIFPNFMLNLYPDNIQLNVVSPLAYDKTRIVFEWYARDSDKTDVANAIRNSIDFSERVQQEDTQLCEDVWRNLQTGVYTQGRYSVKRENGVHHFHGLLAEFSE